MKLVKLNKKYWTRGGFGHWCPGCNSGHEIDTEQSNSQNAIWNFNGDMESPTFTPSIDMRINMPDMNHYQPHAASIVCHYIITNGKIQFCGDCTHHLVNQTVDLPDIPDGAYISSREL